MLAEWLIQYLSRLASSGLPRQPYIQLAASKTLQMTSEALPERSEFYRAMSMHSPMFWNACMAGSSENSIRNRAANIVIASHRRRRCDAANRIGGLDAMAMLRCRIDDHRSRPVDLAGAVSVDIRANPLVVTLRRLDRLGAEGHSLW